MKFIKSLVLATTFLTLTACGGGGGGGDPTIPNPLNPSDPFDPIIITTPSTASEGTVQSPVPLAVGVPRPDSKVGSSFSPSFFKFTTGTEGGYIVALSNYTGDLSWDVYQDAAFTNSVGSCDNFWDNLPANCSVALNAAQTYYLKISNVVSFAGNSFTVAVSEMANEGTGTQPVILPLATIHSGTVNAGGKSYYKFQTNVAGAHTVSYANSKIPGDDMSDSVGIKIFSGADFASGLQASTPENYYASNCTANALAAGTWYYVEVSQSGSYDVRYDIQVNPGISEGTVANPVVLPMGQVHSGGVDEDGFSYYNFIQPTTGSSILTLSAAVSSKLYADSAFTTELKNCSGTSCTLSSLTGGFPYYLKVLGSSNADTPYTIAVAAGSTEGSQAAPVSLPVGPLHNANIDGNGVAYYSFSTGAVSGSYTITLTSSGSAAWTLSSGSTSIYLDNSWDASCSTGAPEYGTCTTAMNLDAGATYNLAVQNSTSTAGSIGITITPGSSEGSQQTPVVVTEGVTYAGKVEAGGNSYYSFVPSLSTSYLIWAANADTQNWDVRWMLYGNADFSGSFRDCYPWAPVTDTICSTTDAYNPETLNAANNYYLQLDNNDALDHTFALQILPFDAAHGCNAGGECEGFEGSLPTYNWNPAFNEGAWGVDTAQTGTGTKSIKSGYKAPTKPNDPQPAYYSCFEFQETNVKWMSFSATVATTGGTADRLIFSVDGSSYKELAGNVPWKRIVVTPTTGTHTYKWCYQKYSSVIGDAAWVDDIEIKR